MDMEQSIANQTQVSITLATHLLSKKSHNSNVVFSPVSIYAVLSLIAVSSNGETLDQLLTFLKANTIDDLNALSSHLISLLFADGSPNGGPRLSLANGVWVDQTLSLRHSFKQVAKTVYHATSHAVDFKTNAYGVVKKVNKWAKKMTNGLIENILSADEVNSMTKLIFANAIYFKGDWIDKFDESKTKDHNFHLLNGTKVKVPFMTTNEKQFVCSYQSFKVLRLPYKRGFTMYFYLPHKNDGLPSLLKEMASKSDDFFVWYDARELKCLSQFLIPKFKVSYGFEASEMLKELGLVLPFTKGGEGLTEMVEDSYVGKNLYVSRIDQKAFLEVNEQGTEAAAVTYSDVMLLGSSRRRIYERIDFVADHPFLFVIREDKSGVVLFIGQVIDPSVETLSDRAESEKTQPGPHRSKKARPAYMGENSARKARRYN